MTGVAVTGSLASVAGAAATGVAVTGVAAPGIAVTGAAVPAAAVVGGAVPGAAATGLAVTGGAVRGPAAAGAAVGGCPVHASAGPVAVLHVTAAHGNGAVDPGGQYVPGAHGPALPAPFLMQLPTAVHIVWIKEPMGQKVPIGHSAEQRGEDKAGVLPYVPGGHGVSSGLASRQNDAAPHGEQGSPPPGEAVPGGQL